MKSRNTIPALAYHLPWPAVRQQRSRMAKSTLPSRELSGRQLHAWVSEATNQESSNKPAQMAGCGREAWIGWKESFQQFALLGCIHSESCRSLRASHMRRAATAPLSYNPLCRSLSDENTMDCACSMSSPFLRRRHVERMDDEARLEGPKRTAILVEGRQSSFPFPPIQSGPRTSERLRAARVVVDLSAGGRGWTQRA